MCAGLFAMKIDMLIRQYNLHEFLRGMTVNFTQPIIKINSIYSTALNNYNFEIKKKIIKFQSIPKKLKGMKIAQLSDIHAGIYLKKDKILEAVKITNTLKPDIMCLTGDFVANSEKYIYPCIEALSLLNPKIGIYSCIGNHDNMVNRRITVEGLESAGLNVMIDENRTVEYKGCEFYIAGIEDGWYRSKPDLIKALKNVPRNSFKILLAHQPDIFKEAATQNVSLTLSGHYHGGQVSVQFLRLPLSVPILVSPYISGLFKKNTSYLYVNNGIGFSGLPFRMNVPPEITLITLA